VRTERRSTVRAQLFYSSVLTVVSTAIRAAHFALSCKCDAVCLLGKIRKERGQKNHAVR
jgi:hypothetical protein